VSKKPPTNEEDDQRDNTQPAPTSYLTDNPKQQRPDDSGELRAGAEEAEELSRLALVGTIAP
jgi:hypothetical protein